MPGRYSENSQRAAIPGKGPIIWLLKAHAQNVPAYGSLLAASCLKGGGKWGYTRVGHIDTYA